jgi:hypothetical protein
MNSKKRFIICTNWYTNKVILKVIKNYHGKEITKIGCITKEPKEYSGVWGYGGDSIAIYFDNEPFCSSDVIEQNKHLLNE